MNENARGVALVTGASAGIGAALAERLAADGRDLVIVARRRERLENLAARLRAESGAAVDVLVADLTEPDDVRRVEEHIRTEQRLDLLVNNAGFPGYGSFAELDPGVADDLIDIHVRAPVRLTRAALPGMIARGRGAIVNVASLLAFSGPLQVPMADHAVYSGAKSFLVTFTQLLAGELEGTGVRAMVCTPGMVESEFHGLKRGGGHGMAIMSAGDVAQAIASGLELGEVVCAPGLEDQGLFDRLRDAQQATLGGARTADLAIRYQGQGGVRSGADLHGRRDRTTEGDSP